MSKCRRVRSSRICYEKRKSEQAERGENGDKPPEVDEGEGDGLGEDEGEVASLNGEG